MILRSFTPAVALLLIIAPSPSAQEESRPEFDPKIEEPAPEIEPPSSGKRRARDIVAIMHDVALAADDTANDVVVIGGNVRVDGSVKGDLVTVLGTVRLGPNASVRRDLVVVGGTLEAPPTAHLGREPVVIGPQGSIAFPFPLHGLQGWLTEGVLLGRPIVPRFTWSWIVAGVFLLLYVLLAALFPRPIQATVNALQDRPGGSLVAGFLALLLIVPLSILLIATVVGILVVPFLLCGFVAAFLLGRVAVYRYAGEQLGHQLGLSFLEKPLVALLIGILLFYLLYIIPVLGLIVWGAIVPLGIGAVLLAMFKSYRSNNPPRVVPPVAVPAATLITPPLLTADAPAVVGLPRVGFWQRFLATCLDAILIGIITVLILRDAPGLLIPVWVLYHILLWSWRGTTIGGIIVGIRIVRLDGAPIRWPVAIVRCLAAFLSAAVLFLGFFWAGWSADKQAWHDKIAGTAMVKVPKGVSLL